MSSDALKTFACVQADVVGIAPGTHDFMADKLDVYGRDHEAD